MEKTVISKNSWHFRWLEHLGLVDSNGYIGTNYIKGEGFFLPVPSYGYVGPKSICPYFWLLALVTWLPLAIAGTFVTFMVKFPMLFGWGITGLLALVLLFIVVGLAMGTIFLLWKGVSYLANKLIIHLENRPKIVKVQGDSTLKLAWKFVQAKKERICPLIDLIE